MRTAKVLLTQPVRGCLCTYHFGFFGFFDDEPLLDPFEGGFWPSL
jgi:hypothetical protein